MKSLAQLLCCFAALEICYCSQSLPLYIFTSSTPTKVNNVLDGSKLYLASSDRAVDLSRIHVTSNGISKTLQQLIGDFDANGFMNGFPVNSDLSISTTNTNETTETLTGMIFISSPHMVQDPNFLVYLVSDQVTYIDRSNYNETTLVLLNVQVPKLQTDPAAKPSINARVEDIKQSKNSQLYIYQDIPGDHYTDSTFQETIMKLIFRNPINLLPTGNTVDTVFFDNIEPIQYNLRSWHIRSVGGGISFNVSREWKDQTAYQTTKESTTGYTMSQSSVYHSNVTYKHTPNHNAFSGYMITTQMFTDMNVTTCNENDCVTKIFLKNDSMAADFFQFPRNDTSLSIDIANVDPFGFYYLQYFRTEQNVMLPTSPNSETTKTLPSSPLPETTTKLGVQSSFIFAIILMIVNLL